MRKPLETPELFISLRSLASDQGGQAVVEYVLMLALVVSIVAVIGATFNRSIRGLWKAMSRDIASACPGCPASPKIR